MAKSKPSLARTKPPADCDGPETPENGTAAVMGAVDSHRMIRKVLSSKAPCRVLDLAAGQGALAEMLVGLGWDVHCADINPANFRLKNVTCEAVDLNQPLPFDDGDFDVILLVNVIHRLYNPAGAIREISRVLRRGGHLYLNANNFSGIVNRVRFLLYGSIEYRDPLEGCDAENPAAAVRVYPTYSRIANWLEASGFEIRELTPSALRWRHRLFAPLGIMIHLLAYLRSPAFRKKEQISAASARATLLGGDYVLIDAVKTLHTAV